MSNDLFSKIELADQTLSNRMVMAPLTRNRAPDNIANAMMAEYYAQRASAGLIITEGTQISEQAVGYPATPGIYNQQQVNGWKQSTDAVHAKGGRIFAQLWHCGRISPINAFNDMSDSDPQSTFNHVVTSLSGLGLAFLHVVEVDMTGQTGPDFNMQQLRDRFDGLYIANGGYDKSRGNQSLAEARADLVAFGVPFLANPDLPERFRVDAPLNEADQATFYGGDEHGYTDYPALGASSWE